jgi:signal peptidase I
VPFVNLVGKAQVIFFSIDEDTSFWEFWRWPADVRWGRIFTVVR